MDAVYILTAVTGVRVRTTSWEILIEAHTLYVLLIIICVGVPCFVRTIWYTVFQNYYIRHVDL